MNTVKAMLLILIFALQTAALALPANFVYLSDVGPGIKQDIRYYSTHNFIGKRIAGYQAPRCILTRDTAMALAAIQKILKKRSLSLLVYDCYRPQSAVDNFVAWSKNPLDQKNKMAYYPHIDKPDLFKEGYIASRSGHTRGSTVDLTIVTLNMGTHFDFLDPLSNPLSPHVTGKPKQNRMLLRKLMLQHGFVPLTTEWWHFTLKDETYPDTYFDFPVA